MKVRKYLTFETPDEYLEAVSVGRPFFTLGPWAVTAALDEDLESGRYAITHREHGAAAGHFAKLSDAKKAVRALGEVDPLELRGEEQAIELKRVHKVLVDSGATCSPYRVANHITDPDSARVATRGSWPPHADPKEQP